MSKIVLIVAALFCLATVAAGQTAGVTQISTVFFTGSASDAAMCTGANFTTSADAGKCTGAGSKYSASFCSDDGAYVYTFSYTDSSCNSTYATGVVQIPTSCAFLAAKLQYKCSIPTAGNNPAAPFAFPPTNWAQSTSCVNSTDSYKPASVCSAGTDATIKCTKSAAVVSACASTGLVALPSMSSGCSADGTNAISVYYSDAKCTTVGMAYVTAVGCYNGVQASCSANAVPALPNKGFTTYKDSACGTVAGSAPVTTLFTDGCVNSQSFACSTINGTTAGTFTQFVDPSFKGTCPADGAKVTVQQVGVCVAGKQFTCNYAPVTPSGGMASSTGASMVAMIVAAIVALIASLSL